MWWSGFAPARCAWREGGLGARVDLIEDLGDTAVLDLDCAGTMIRMRVADGNIPGEGDTISITARPQDIHLFDPATRMRL